MSILTAAYATLTDISQSVLIHSATGGLGIACIQIAQYIGAKVSDKNHDC